MGVVAFVPFADSGEEEENNEVTVRTGTWDCAAEALVKSQDHERVGLVGGVAGKVRRLGLGDGKTYGEQGMPVRCAELVFPRLEVSVPPFPPSAFKIRRERWKCRNER